MRCFILMLYLCETMTTIYYLDDHFFPPHLWYYVGKVIERWSKYKQPRKISKLVSLFISPRGEHVAVASGNYITILQKEDDYTKPCGTFTSKI